MFIYLEMQKELHSNKVFSVGPVSLSHTDDYSTAVAVAYGKNT